MTFALAAIVDALEDANLLESVRGELPRTISLVTDDSRAVRAGALFLAVRGAERDGHDYLDAAAAAAL